MASVICPMPVEDSVMREVQELAAAAKLSPADVLRRALQEGLPALRTSLGVAPAEDGPLVDAWVKRAETLESFYDPAKEW